MSKYVEITNGLVRDWFPVTASDSTDNVKANVNDRVIGFYVTVGGTINISNYQGVDRTITVADKSTITFVDATRVKATGTTATGIFSLVI